MKLTGLHVRATAAAGTRPQPTPVGATRTLPMINRGNELVKLLVEPKDQEQVHHLQNQLVQGISSGGPTSADQSAVGEAESLLLPAKGMTTKGHNMVDKSAVLPTGLVLHQWLFSGAAWL